MLTPHRPVVWPLTVLLAGVVVGIGGVSALSGTAGLVALGGLVLGVVLTVVLMHRPAVGGWLTPVALAQVALGIGLAVALAVALRSSGSSEQAFALYGQSKRLTLPAIIVVFAVFAATLLARGRTRRSTPLWWRGLALLVIASTTAALMAPRQLLDLDDAAQALTLMSGVLLMSWFGLQCDEWTASSERTLVFVLGAGAVGSGVIASGLTPFTSLLVPATFAALTLACRQPDSRGVYAVATVALLVLTARYLLRLDDETSGGLSLAVAGEVLGCAALFTLMLAPRRLRLPIMFVAAVSGIVALVRSGVGDLVLGRWQGFEDITLAHRGFETHQVIEALGHSPLSWLLGLGPAATVDLTGSPDASTLLAAGRTLSAVDDVHILSSYLLLKFGVLGLLWLTLFLGSIARLVRGVRNELAPFDQALLFFIAAGVVSSLPAATNLFTNPLPFLLLGMLEARRRVRHPCHSPLGIVTRADDDGAGPSQIEQESTSIEREHRTAEAMTSDSLVNDNGRESSP